MLTIIKVSDELIQLGARLRAARLARDEPMQLFAQRIGVSAPTLRAMEQGADTVAIKHWANALWALDRLSDLAAVLPRTESLLDLARREAQPRRQRARRRTMA